MSSRALSSVEAEQSVLGGLLLDNDRIDAVADLISEADFASTDHASIFAAIAALSARGKPADVITVSDMLDRQGRLAAVGGIAYIGELLANVPGTANIRHYAEIVRDRRLERQLLQTGERMMNLARDTGPVAERLDTAQSLIMTLTETTSMREPERIGSLLRGFVEEVEKRHESDTPVVGISTGIRDLDAKLAGLHDGQLIVIAGRPGMGKSALAQQIADHAALRGTPAAYFSLEMSRNEFVERAVANIGRLDGERIRNATGLTADDWERFSLTVGRLNEAPLFIDDSPDATVARVRAKARRLKRKHGIKLLVVDYLQLMSGQGESRREEVDSISRGLKLLAKELQIPVIALAQLSRKCEERTNKRPILSDLRESGSVEQDADVVLLLYRDEVYDEGTDRPGVIEISIAKQRMGPTGTVYATWLGDHYAVADRAEPFVLNGASRGRRRSRSLVEQHDL